MLEAIVLALQGFAALSAEWATALIALLALCAAVRAGHIAAQLLKVEQVREDRAEIAEKERRQAEEGRRQDLRRAHQADRVAAWVAYLPEKNDYESFGAEILNGSRLPIYDVSAMFIAPDGRKVHGRWDLKLVRPRAQKYIPVPEKLIQATNMDPSAQKPSAGQAYTWAELRTELQVETTFRDTTGAVWRRDARGLLNEVDPPDESAP